MASSAAVVNRLFERAAESDNVPVTHLKVQKLLYFAHGLYLARTGHPLVEDGFEAWDYGPVCPPVYHDLKWFGMSPIRNYRMPGQYDVLSEQERLAVDDIWDALGNSDAGVLVDLTHREGTPWNVVYRPDVYGIRIDDGLILNFFRHGRCS